MPGKDRNQKWTSILDPKTSVISALKDIAVLDVQTHVIGATEDDVVLRIDTEIEQVTGDIKNTISETAFTRDYGERLLSYHERQRDAATDILKRNVEAIGGLIEMLDRIRRRNKKEDEK